MRRKFLNVYSLPENEDELEEECDKDAADEFTHLEVPRQKGGNICEQYEAIDISEEGTEPEHQSYDT
jgi:hypothetical protein